MEEYSDSSGRISTSLIDGRIPEDEIDRYVDDYQISLTRTILCGFLFYISVQQISSKYEYFSAWRICKKKNWQRSIWRMNGSPESLCIWGDIVVITQLESQEQITEFVLWTSYAVWQKHVRVATVTAGIGYVHSIIFLILPLAGCQKCLPRNIWKMPVPSILQKLIPWRMRMSAGKNRKFRKS